MKKRIFVVAVCASVLCGCGSSTASGSADSAVSDAVEAAASENTETVASESTETAASETSEEAAESTQKVEQTEPLTGYTPENASGLTDFFQNLVPEDQCFYPTGAHAAGVLVYRNDIWSEEMLRSPLMI